LEEVIKQIIEIEKKAKQLIESANEEKIKKEKLLDQNLKELEKDIMERANGKVVQIRKREIEEAHNEADNILNQCEQRLKKLEDYYNENHEKWCTELFNAVTKR